LQAAPTRVPLAASTDVSGVPQATSLRFASSLSISDGIGNRVGLAGWVEKTKKTEKYLSVHQKLIDYNVCNMHGIPLKMQKMRKEQVEKN
jgi:hypothetical protein